MQYTIYKIGYIPLRLCDKAEFFLSQRIAYTDG